MGVPTPKPYTVTFTVNGRPLDMQIDTGAAVSFISLEVYRQRFTSVSLTSSPVNVHFYTSEPIEVLGQIKVSVTYQGYTGYHPLVVVKRGSTLMGRDWLSKIRLDWNSIKLLSTQQPQSLSVERLTKKVC